MFYTKLIHKCRSLTMQIIRYSTQVAEVKICSRVRHSESLSSILEIAQELWQCYLQFLGHQALQESRSTLEESRSALNRVACDLNRFSREGGSFERRCMYVCLYVKHMFSVA